jgi:hypothetical protein
MRLLRTMAPRAGGRPSLRPRRAKSWNQTGTSSFLRESPPYRIAVDRLTGRWRMSIPEPPQMTRLQHLIDTVFGQPEAHRAAQAPSEFTAERERTFEAAARKVAALRQAGLARGAPKR